MLALFVSNIVTLHGLSVIRPEIEGVERDVIAAGFFTSSGGTPERAGLMGGYSWLMNLYIMKESCHAIANEKPFYPGGKKNTWNRYLFIFPSDGRKIEQTWPDFRR